MMIRTWHRRLFLLAALLMLLAMGMAVRSALLTDQSLRMVLHTDEVMARFLRLRAVLSEAESTARGHAIAGDAVSLALLGQSKNEALQEVARLRELTRDNPTQQDLLDRISFLMTSRFAAFDVLVAERKTTEDIPSLVPLIDEGRGVMRSLQTRVDEGLERERLLFLKRDARLGRYLRHLPAAAIASGLLALLMAGTGVVLMRRTQKAALRAAVLEADQARAEFASQAKSRFLAGLVQEIRTPLDAILGFADTLSGLSARERQRECLEGIRAGGRCLQGLVNDILDFSRIKAGSLPLQPHPVDIRDIIRDTAALFKVQVEQRNLVFTCRTSPEVPEMLCLDAERVRQILASLIAHTLKTTFRGGVMVEASGAARLETPEKFDLQLRISESRAGDPSPTPAKQTPPIPSAAGGPAEAGLGLSMARHLAQLMGGALIPGNDPHAGAIFTVSLPETPVATRPGKAGCETAPESRSTGAAGIKEKPGRSRLMPA